MLLHKAFLSRRRQRDDFLPCRMNARRLVLAWCSRVCAVQMHAFLLLGMVLSAPAPATAQVTVSEPLPANIRYWRCWLGEGNSAGIVCMSDDAEQLVPIVMVIDLHAPPLEPAFTAELAQSIMCRPNTDCRTEYLVSNGF